MKNYSISKKKKEKLIKIKQELEENFLDEFINENLTTQKEVMDFINNLNFNDPDLKEVELKQPDISKYADELGIVKDRESNQYVLEKYQSFSVKMDDLKEALREHSASNILNNPAMIALKADEGAAELLGTKFSKLYPEDILGYINNRELLIIIFKSKKVKQRIIDQLK